MQLPKFDNLGLQLKVGGYLPAIHRSITTIIFLRITILLTILLEKVRKRDKSKEFGIKLQFHTGKALHENSKHAQEQSLTPKGWLYSDGTLSK